MARYTFSFRFSDEDGNYVSGEGVVLASDEDEAVEAVQTLVGENLTVERTGGTYLVTLGVSFTFEDEEGEYEDEDEVRSAIRDGSIDWTSEDYEVDDISVEDSPYN